MRLILSILLVLLVVAALAVVGTHYLPGSLRLVVGGWEVEIDPVLFAVGGTLAFILLHLLLRLLSALLRLPGRIRKAVENRQQERVQGSLADGLSLLLEGQWARAEQCFKQGLTYPRQALHCYLGAAEAAFRQGDEDRSLQYLRQAGESGKRADLRAGLLEARLLQSSGKEAAAAGCLEALHSKYQGNRLVQQRLLEAYRASGNWEAVVGYARQMKLSRMERADLLQQAYLGCLRPPAGSKPDVHRLEWAWQQIPRKIRMNPRLVKAYVTESLRSSGAGHCEGMLRKTLRSEYDPELVVLYALVQSPQPARQLAFLEGLLKQYPQDPRLLLAVGMLSGRLKLWGKARSYIQQSRDVDPRPESLRAMANLLEQQGNFEAAAQYYRQGLDMLADGARGGGAVTALPGMQSQPSVRKGLQGGATEGSSDT